VALAALVMGVVVESPATGQLHPERPGVAGLRARRSRPRTARPTCRVMGTGPNWDGKTAARRSAARDGSVQEQGLLQRPRQWLDRVTGDATARDRSRHAQRRRRLRHVRSAHRQEPACVCNGGATAPRTGRAKHREPVSVQDAKDHYDALLAAARARGGPTKHTYATMPKWDGSTRVSPKGGACGTTAGRRRWRRSSRC